MNQGVLGGRSSTSGYCEFSRTILTPEVQTNLANSSISLREHGIVGVSSIQIISEATFCTRACKGSHRDNLPGSDSLGTGPSSFNSPNSRPPNSSRTALTWTALKIMHHRAHILGSEMVKVEAILNPSLLLVLIVTFYSLNCLGQHIIVDLCVYSCGLLQSRCLDVWVTAWCNMRIASMFRISSSGLSAGKMLAL